MITSDSHDSRAAFRYRSFRLLLISSFVTVVAEQMLGVAIGWELYERTDSAFALGMVGLVQVVPVVLLALPAGHAVDRYDRKIIAMSTYAAVAFGAGGLLLL